MAGCRWRTSKARWWPVNGRTDRSCWPVSTLALRSPRSPLPAGRPRQRKTGIAFSPDGTRLIMVTESAGPGIDARLIWRDISDDALVRAACETAGRNLTAAEWRTFVGTDLPRDLSCR